MPKPPADTDVIPGTKRCARCKLPRPIDPCFYREKSGRIASYCKTCNRIASHYCVRRPPGEARLRYKAEFRASPLGKLVARRSYCKKRAADNPGTQKGLRYRREHDRITEEIARLKGGAGG